MRQARVWKITHREVALLPVLLESLKHSDEKVCLTAIATVRAIGPNARAAVPLLIALTRSSSYVLPYSSVTALGKIGPDAAVAVPRLVEMLDDRSDTTRVEIAGLFWTFSPTPRWRGLHSSDGSRIRPDIHGNAPPPPWAGTPAPRVQRFPAARPTPRSRISVYASRQRSPCGRSHKRPTRSCPH